MKSLFMTFVVAFSSLTALSDMIYAAPAGLADDTLRIYSTPELNHLTSAWLKAYALTDPNIKFSASSGNHETFAGKADIAFLSDNAEQAGEVYKWRMTVAYSVLVPVFNSSNPLRGQIIKSGLSPSQFAELFSGKGETCWNDLIKEGKGNKVNLFMSGDNATKERITGFINKDAIILPEMIVKQPVDVISSVQNDPYAIGFCDLADIVRPGTNELPENISLLGIDRNQNGRIDNFENIYENPAALLRGAWIGKYPHQLCRSVYAASVTKPVKKNSVDFLEWIMSGGGEILSTSGFSGLTGMEKESYMAILSSSTEAAETKNNEPALSGLWFMAVVVVLLGGLLTVAVIRFISIPKPVSDEIDGRAAEGFNPATIDAPKGLYFDKTHTWAFMEKDGMIRVGIDDFIQHITGPITGIKLREPGETVRRGEKVMTIIKDGKQLYMYAPVSGTIKSQNTDLYYDSSIINASPYRDGWIYLIEPKNWLREIQFMFMADKYFEWIIAEFTRLKEFLNNIIKARAEYSPVILQDGGEITDNVLSNLGPESWEDFQTGFLDTSR